MAQIIRRQKEKAPVEPGLTISFLKLNS